MQIKEYYGAVVVTRDEKNKNIKIKAKDDADVETAIADASKYLQLLNYNFSATFMCGGVSLRISQFADVQERIEEYYKLQEANKHI